MGIKQVVFKVDGFQEILAGIRLENGFVVCARYGEVFEPEEVEILFAFDNWVDFSDIIGAPFKLHK